ECGVPGVILMENAGRGAAEIIAARLRRANAPVLVLCGTGNNGRDGFVVARRLLTLGYEPQVFLTCDPQKLRGDALINYRAYAGLRREVQRLDAGLDAFEQALTGAAAVVDGLLGTGLDRELDGLVAELVERCNAAPVQRFALDLPTGLHANDGRVLGDAFRADVTISFAGRKLGLLTPNGKEVCGELCVVDIGVPGELPLADGDLPDLPVAELVEALDLKPLLPSRRAALHKGSAGRVTVLGGSAGKTGAALLSARAAHRAGAGLVTICNYPEAVLQLDTRVVEAMTRALDPVRAEASLGEALAEQTAIVVGPGLGLDSRAKLIVNGALGWPGPKLFDADALTHFSGRAAELAVHTGELVLTPHPAELGRLLGISAQQVEANRFAAVERASELTRATVLLKGPYTLIKRPGVATRINPSGSAVLATGGSGDVLSGVIGALLSHLPGLEAATLGAYLHGLAGELWADERGAQVGLLASELADQVPHAWSRLAD
ncbi:MAG: NAD(P)H-hydrate dehydratase, partial [Myxococcales bacterium]|nr:NAD(P)H-hydrate dehydratase [Myxococcales bacterium]